MLALRDVCCGTPRTTFARSGRDGSTARSASEGRLRYSRACGSRCWGWGSSAVPWSRVTRSGPRGVSGAWSIAAWTPTGRGRGGAPARRPHRRGRARPGGRDRGRGPRRPGGSAARLASAQLDELAGPLARRPRPGCGRSPTSRAPRKPSCCARWRRPPVRRRPSDGRARDERLRRRRARTCSSTGRGSSCRRRSADPATASGSSASRRACGGAAGPPRRPRRTTPRSPAISHLPLVVAAALVEAVAGDGSLRVAGLADGCRPRRERLARHDAAGPRRHRDGRRDHRHERPGDRRARCASSWRRWTAGSTELERPAARTPAAVADATRSRSRAASRRCRDERRAASSSSRGDVGPRAMPAGTACAPEALTACLERSIARDGRFEPRAAMEIDPSFKQVIPYLVLRDGDALLPDAPDAGRRRRAAARPLVDRGRRPPEPGRRGPRTAGLRREWPEELVADFDPEFELVGLLNDDTTDVGSVHLGAVFVADAARPAGRDPRDATSSAARSPTPAEVAAVADRPRDVEPARLRGLEAAPAPTTVRRSVRRSDAIILAEVAPS